MSNPQYDVVVFGATSFVGQILTQYLADQFGLNGSLKWAIAGRSESKLAEVKAALGAVAADLPVLVANADSEKDMLEMCEKTRVVVSTVGPYALFGEALVKACAESGTDYCDLTGEAQWIHKMLERYEPKAKASGARIVHCCGFDSIPSDMGNYFLQQQAQEKFGEPCVDVKMRVKAIRGGASGGTIASAMNAVKEAVASPALRKVLGNPHSLSPSVEGTRRPRQVTVKGPVFDKELNSWTAPFVMAAINEKVVLRSNALVDKTKMGNEKRSSNFSDEFMYQEGMLTGPGFSGRMKALGVTVGLGSFMGAAVVPPLRWALEKFVLPKPGEGPTPRQQEKGFYDIRFVGKTASGKTLITKVVGDRDPGYGSTAKMLGQSAVHLALDFSSASKTGGFWTTATIFGPDFIERLEKDAGLAFEVVEG